MGQTVINPQTGQRYELVGRKWVPVAKHDAARAEAAPTEPLTTGAINAALVSAGDTISTVGLNARDLWASVTGNEQAKGEIAAERQEAGDIRARLHEEAPIAAGIGAALPGLATLPLGGGVATQLALGAATSGATSQSCDILQDAALGAGMGLAGMGASNIASRVWKGRGAMRDARAAIAAQGDDAAKLLQGGLHQGQKEILEGADRVGMIVTPGQRAGSNTARDMEAGMRSIPGMGQVFAEIERKNKETLQGLAAAAMGVKGADNVGAEVRAIAEAKLSEKFADIGKRIGPVDTKPLQKALQELSKDESTALLPRLELDSIVKRFESGQGARTMAVKGAGVDQVSGEALMRERSRIAKQMRDAYARNDSSAGELYGNVLDAMDESVKRAAIRSAGGDVKAGLELGKRYDQARSEWSVLRAVDRGGATIDGEILPGQMARLMKSSDKGGFWGRADDAGQSLQRRSTGKLGDDAQGDFYDALRFAESRIGKASVGDSGTATRSAMQNWLTGGSSLASVGANAATQAGRRLGLMPLAQLYAGISPESAAIFGATLQSMRGVPFGQTGAAGIIGQGAARGIGSMGGL